MSAPTKKDKKINRYNAPYVLYLRTYAGDEPKRQIKDKESPLYGEHVPRWGSHRLCIVAEFVRYKDLVAHAQALMVQMNAPKTKWMSVFDWNV